MNIINKSARLIDFSWNKEKYRLMPAGEPVKVPDEAMKSAFLKSLLDSGDIKVDETTGQSGDDDAIDALRVEAKDLGVSIDNRWGEARLKEEIEKALEE